MPRDSSGNYILPPSNPVQSGTVITADWGNETMGDMAQEMQDSLSRSGNGGMLAPFKAFAGTKNAPGITFNSSPTVGLYLAANNEMRASVGNVDMFRIRQTAFEAYNPADGLWYPILNTKTAGSVVETVTLTEGQTVVPFAPNVAGASMYYNAADGERGRLLYGDDYTYDPIENEITLTFPAVENDKISAVYGDETLVVQAAEAARASAIAAAASAAEAGDYLFDFNSRYYGPAASDPAVDPNGNPPTAGDMYFNTTINLTRVFDGVDWVDITDGAPDQDQVTLVYDTVEDMKADTTLTAGQLARTKGYYAAGDGGGALYLIAENQPVDGYGDHLLANGNAAVIQDELEINTLAYGAKFDGTTDDTDAIQAAIDKGVSIGLDVLLPKGTARITAGLRMSSPVQASFPMIKGAGNRETIFKADYSGGVETPIFDIEGPTSGLLFAYAGGLSGIGIEQEAGAINLAGIRCLSWWYGTIYDVRVTGIDFDPLYTELRNDINVNPDYYATIGLKIESCLWESTRYGANQRNGVGSSGWEFKYTRVAGAKLGGDIISGHNTRLFGCGYGLQSADAADNEGFNIRLDSINGAPQNTFITHNEFDASKDNHIIINASSGLVIKGNRFITSDRLSLSQATPDIHVDVRGTNIYMEAEGNFHRIDDNFGTVTLYNDPGPGNSTGAKINQARVEDNGFEYIASVGFGREYDNDVRILETLPITAKFLQATLTDGVSITGTSTALVFDDVSPPGQTQYISGTFTANITGRYRVRCTLRCTVADNTQIIIDNRINGVRTDMTSTTQCLTGSSNSCSLHGISSLSAGDTMVVRASVVSGVSFDLDSVVAYAHTLEIELI